MKAYVKVRKGNFPDVNYYAAWKGLNEIGYEVIKFEEEEQDTIEVTAETPVFAGVGSCRKIIKRVFGFDYVGINPYPTELMPMMGRSVKRARWGDVKKEALEGHLFVKPVIQKQFTGLVLSTLLDTIKTAKVEDDHEVYLCGMVDFLSEFRVYVHEGEVIGVKHYFGDWERVPQANTIKEMVKAYRPSAPVSYGMDIGVIKEHYGYRDVLVEINDGICLGNYGLDTVHYAEMIASRWMEIGVEKKVEKELDEWKKSNEERPTDSDWMKDLKKESRKFFKDHMETPNQRDGYTGKNYKLQSEIKKTREKALKAYADEIKTSLEKEDPRKEVLVEFTIPPEDQINEDGTLKC